MKKIMKWGAIALACLVLGVLIVYFLFPSVVIDMSIRSARSDAGVTVKNAPLDGFSWPYLEGGSGDTVVFFHGFGLSKDMWGELLPALAKRYHVVAPDMPGFGDNNRLKDAAYNVKGQALMLDRFLGKLGMKHFHLVGFSMGGGVAAWYASAFPEKVQSLVLIDAFGVKAAVKNDAEKALERGEKVLLFRNADEYDAVIRLAYANPPAIPGHFKRYLASLGQKDYHFHGMIFDSLARDGLGCNEKILGGIKAPTLVLWGADDGIFHVTCADRYCAGIRDCRKVVLEGSGHMVYLEKPGESVREVTDFLAKK